MAESQGCPDLVDEAEMKRPVGQRLWSNNHWRLCPNEVSILEKCLSHNAPIEHSSWN